MTYPKPKEVFEMFEKMVKTHSGEMITATLDWEVLHLTSPGYSKKIDYPAPLVLIEFK